MLRAELESRAAFTGAVDAVVPPSWPPELYDADAIRWTLNWLEQNPEDAEWGFYYIALRNEPERGRRTLVGVGGYKGGPVGGVVSEYRRRGFASEAVDAWVTRAFADPRITLVAAHTLAELAPSIGVLEKAGFAFVGQGSDAQEPSAIRYELPRERHARRRST
jgi:RimJ/RimL family protein N-acetyltransferase